MVIDADVAAFVRAALDAAIRDDEDAFASAIGSPMDDDSWRSALEFAVAVSIVALYDGSDAPPSPDHVRRTAQRITEREHWAAVTATTVQRFLEAVLAGEPLTRNLDPDTAIDLIFIVAGSLVASPSTVTDGGTWRDYLDRIEAIVEVAPQCAGSSSAAASGTVPSTASMMWILPLATR